VIAHWARDSVEPRTQLRERLGGITAAPAESTFRHTLLRVGIVSRLFDGWVCRDR
jgi:hypothetical protein